MYEKISDVGRTRQLISTKMAYEDNLAADIYAAFDQGPLLRELNSMARIAATRMQNWDSKMDMNIAVAKKYGGSPAKIAYAASKNMLSARLCGDLIRLYGEAAEEIQSMDRERVSYQQHKDEGFWDKKRGGFRQRVLAQEEHDPSGRGGVAKKVDASVFGAEYVGKRKVVRRTSGEMAALGGAGIARWMPTERDVLYRIERTFGLKVGATISGTTTDTIYFLESVPQSVDPIFYLLPVATIAAQQHHALIETAAALTINKKMSYSIGFYSTLMPHNSNHPESGRILDILQRYENDSFSNDLFLVHRSNLANITGCYVFDNSNQVARTEFGRLGLANRTLLEEFKALNKGYATEDDLIRWIMHSRRTRGGSSFLGWN
jgi:hypothetical protein